MTHVHTQMSIVVQGTAKSSKCQAPVFQKELIINSYINNNYNGDQ